MASSWTKNLQLEKPATGDQAGTWGDTANRDYDIIDSSIEGNKHITLSDSDYTLLTDTSAGAEGRNKVIIWSGTLTANRTVNISPNSAQKLYIMSNATSGGFSIIFSAQGATGGTFTLTSGCSAIIYCDGAGATARVDGALYSAQFGSVVVQQNLSVAGNASFAQPVSFAGNITATGLTVNTPGVPNATNDIYYRASSGLLTPLPIGTSGQVLQVQPSLQIGWSTPPTLSNGSPVASATANSIFYASNTGALAQDANVTINPGVGVGIGMLSAHAFAVGHAYVPEIWLDASDPAVSNQQ